MYKIDVFSYVSFAIFVMIGSASLGALVMILSGPKDIIEKETDED